tara:strand:- start:229 stop:384 length:156 start_codon:yes stop_codon:yes gene_type:complete
VESLSIDLLVFHPVWRGITDSGDEVFVVSPSGKELQHKELARIKFAEFLAK